KRVTKTLPKKAVTQNNKLIHVAAAVIEKNQQIFIAKRPDHVHQGGLWEFPGGKVEPEEHIEQALIRELQEEIGITPTRQEPLIQIQHDYPDKSVLLDVWKVTEFNGEAHGKEGQPVRWVSKDQLTDYQFPAANLPIILAAQLPSFYLITPQPEADKLEEFLSAFQRSLTPDNISLAQLRAKNLPAKQFEELAQAALAIAQRQKVRLYINCDLTTAQKLDLQYAHLSSPNLAKLSSRPENLHFAASCHTRQELELAHQYGADFAVLSCVNKTKSHPNVTPLGWNNFQQLSLHAKIPIFALGGLQISDLYAAKYHGAQGIAGITGFWQG
ncbi:MAG: Nudix family hydrolase, partial [Gammaproteobacteria bacterium]|nr:Nudix family hydrolase [Gammaproteobacteria bacterium]